MWQDLSFCYLNIVAPPVSYFSMFFRATEGHRALGACVLFLELAVAGVYRRRGIRFQIEAILARFFAHIRVLLPVSNHLRCPFDTDLSMHVVLSTLWQTQPLLPGSQQGRKSRPADKFGAKSREKFSKGGTETNRGDQGHPPAGRRVQGNGHPNGLREIRFSSMV